MVKAAASSRRAPSLPNTLPPYVAGLGLRAHPFPVTPDETQYFFTAGTEALYHELRHFIETCRGFMLVTGEVGLGKTTLLRRVMNSLDPQRYNTALVLTSFLDQAELLEAVTRDFGVELPPQSRRIDHLAALNAFLVQQSAAGKINVLFIDDAQALDAQALDVVRQLSNLETATHKLIQVVLVGQPEIMQTLNLHGLRQVRSRFAMCRQLSPLSRDELAAYVVHRLTLAGNAQAVRLTSNGLTALYRLSGGYPRRVHLLMDRCLYAAMLGNSREVDAAVVRLAWNDLGPLHHGASGAPGAWWQATAWLRQRGLGRKPALAALVLAVGLAAFLMGRAMPPAGVSRAAPVAADSTPRRVPEAVAAAPLAAPADWAATLAQLPGLAQLAWPRATDYTDLTQRLATAAQAAGWRFTPVDDGFAKPCGARPVWRVTDQHGKVHQFTLIEASLPQQAMAIGPRHAAVRAAQKRLVAGGYLPADSVDGYVGPNLLTALARFQGVHQIERTGQFSPATAYRLSCIALPSGAAHD
ncbi:MAG: AAA family ATPase [Burkholderiaceae bacterium]|nr:AAA family ATPase [Burkholderiaceae bacterium]